MTKQHKVIDGTVEDVVTEVGNSGHVILPKAWVGRTVTITIKQEKTKGR
jgi:putative transposon-encoded protein